QLASPRVGIRRAARGERRRTPEERQEKQPGPDLHEPPLRSVDGVIPLLLPRYDSPLDFTSEPICMELWAFPLTGVRCAWKNPCATERRRRTDEESLDRACRRPGPGGRGDASAASA